MRNSFIIQLNKFKQITYKHKQCFEKDFSSVSVTVRPLSNKEMPKAKPKAIPNLSFSLRQGLFWFFRFVETSFITSMEFSRSCGPSFQKSTNQMIDRTSSNSKSSWTLSKIRAHDYEENFDLKFDAFKLNDPFQKSYTAASTTLKPHWHPSDKAKPSLPIFPKQCTAPRILKKPGKTKYPDIPSKTHKSHTPHHPTDPCQPNTTAPPWSWQNTPLLNHFKSLFSEGFWFGSLLFLAHPTRYKSWCYLSF